MVTVEAGWRRWRMAHGFFAAEEYVTVFGLNTACVMALFQ